MAFHAYRALADFCSEQQAIYDQLQYTLCYPAASRTNVTIEQALELLLKNDQCDYFFTFDNTEVSFRGEFDAMYEGLTAGCKVRDAALCD